MPQYLSRRLCPDNSPRPANLATIVMTAPRVVDYLPQTLQSLTAAGFLGVTVSTDSEKRGPVPAYYVAIRKALRVNPGADAVVVFQDDVIVSRGLCEFVELMKLPGDSGNVGCLSLYCSSLDSLHIGRVGHASWSVDHHWMLKPLKLTDSNPQPWRDVHGALAFVWPRASAEQFLVDAVDIGNTRYDDHLIGKWCSQTGKSMWIHYPSYVQHVGKASSLSMLPKPSDADAELLPGRMASSFVECVEGFQ